MQFDFGKNWDDFSRHALNQARIASARESFTRLMRSLPLQNQSFLDIGFGQGLSLLLAAEAGALVVGCDINPKCAEVLRMNRAFFSAPVCNLEIPSIIGSILDDAVVDIIRQRSPSPDHAFDIVHSWGVLHHTGNMAAAIAHAASLVRPHGHLVLAIYNRHWTSPIWKLIKHVYCSSPEVLQKLVVGLFLPVIFLARLAVTGRAAFSRGRGMAFYHDVVDWVGGYPYEYATINEIIVTLKTLGFECIEKRAAEVPTGCNEFVFKRIE